MPSESLTFTKQVIGRRCGRIETLVTQAKTPTHPTTENKKKRDPWTKARVEEMRVDRGGIGTYGIAEVRAPGGKTHLWW